MNVNPFSLLGKEILVTGASSGIGLSTCQAITDMGGSFIGMGRNLTALQNKFGSKYKKIQHDLMELERIDEIVDQIEPIDGFVHSAGIVEVLPMKFFNQKKYEQLQKVNVESFLVLMTSLMRKKKLKKNASIVIISSISGSFGAKGYGMYGMTKASLDLAAKVYAHELAHLKIRVNTVACGMVKTQVTLDAIEKLGEEEIKKDELKYPLGYGEPEDVANSVVFLLSNASKWITGEVIAVDGGRTATI